MNTIPARRRLPWLLSLWTVLALLAAACGSPPAAPVAQPTAVPQENKSLLLLEWTGYELPEFYPGFTAQHADITPEFTFFADDSEAFAKMEAGFEADIIHPCTAWLRLYAENGLIQPIDTSRLKEWASVPEVLRQEGQVDGKQYLVPWDWGYESILVRSDKVSTLPDEWADLWDPQYQGHVSLYDAPESAVIITALALGLDPYNLSAEQQAQVKQKLIDIKPNLLNYWSDFTEVDQLLAQGDTWLAANTWTSDYLLLQGQGVPVEYIQPKEGRLGWVCGFTISTQSRNVDLAYDYINAALAPEPMAYLGNEYAYGFSNLNALPLVDPAYVQTFGLDQPEKLRETTFFYQSINAEQREIFTNLWSEVKAAP